MIPTQNVPDILSRARSLVTPGLRIAVDSLSLELRPLATYHLGWTDADGKVLGGDGGKGVRPALAVLSAEAVGAEAEVGVPGAVAIELVHNFSLIHDDVIDGDAERRHRATIWAVFGTGRAIIVGDALLALAQRVVLEPGLVGLGPSAVRSPVETVAASQCLADATAAMIAGQALDMAFETVADVDVAGCLAMEAGKTGALLGCASSIGAVLAGAGPESVAALQRYGIELGMAFQAIDDLLGIWGDPATTGKPAWSDLRQHKKTLPVATALASGGARAEELAKLLVTDDLDESDIARAADLVESCGGRVVAQEEAERRLEMALAAIESAPLEPKAADELGELARFVVDRSF